MKKLQTSRWKFPSASATNIIFGQILGMKYLSAIEAKELIDNGSATLLDVREPYEFDICSIGGIQIPMGDVAGRVKDLNKADMFIVMCRSGKRAEALANLMESDYNFSNMAVLSGGLEAWIAEVDPNLESY
ncbi:MAG: rhodanese-like domain-containing protein [Bacteroidetes bacterium]|nr:MAG: rhodanese-like domain-containing protein [Bacteroidota bacterium]